MVGEGLLPPLAQLVYHQATPKVIVIYRLTLFSFNVLTTIITKILLLVMLIFITVQCVSLLMKSV